MFIIGAVWPAASIVLIVLLMFFLRIDLDENFAYIVVAVVAASLLIAHRYVSGRGGYDISYEFYERVLKYNYMEYGLDGKTAPKKRSISLPYFEIRGVELAPRPPSSDDKFVDIHVSIHTPEMRKLMCGTLNPNKEFFLFDIPATERPIRRIRELLESYHEKNPRADEFAAMLGAT
ncbi:MAG: hypothetical protein HND56_07490 [Pseudomonadota bacterium]|nr:MAG: hypothetical protein HND56_07490 [Pseudomonadota bacterium]